MTKFFLALIAAGVATLIGACVIVAFRPQNPLLHRPQTLRAAPPHERTLTPSPESGEPSESPSDRFWPVWTILRFRPIAVMFGGLGIEVARHGAASPPSGTCYMMGVPPSCDGRGLWTATRSRAWRSSWTTSRGW